MARLDLDLSVYQPKTEYLTRAASQIRKDIASFGGSAQRIADLVEFGIWYDDDKRGGIPSKFHAAVDGIIDQAFDVENPTKPAKVLNVPTEKMASIAERYIRFEAVGYTSEQLELLVHDPSAWISKYGKQTEIGDPVDLLGSYGRVAEIPDGVMPSVIENAAKVRGANLGVTSGGVAMMMLGVCAGALDCRINIYPEPIRSPDRWAPPIVFTALIGGASVKKTPVLNSAAGPLSAIAKRETTRYHTQSKAHEAAKKAKQQTTAPVPHRNFMDRGGTAEGLEKTCAEYPQSPLEFYDELEGFFTGMGSYGGDKTKDRAAWKAFYGRLEGVISARKGKDSQIYAEAIGPSLVGGVTPAALDSTSNQLDSNDGMGVRILAGFIEKAAKQRGAMSLEDKTALQAYNDIFQHLVLLEQMDFVFSSEAETKFEAAQTWLEDAAEAAFETEMYQSAIGKLPEYIARISGVFHIIDWAASYSKSNLTPGLEIGVAVVDRAISLAMDFLIETQRAWTVDVLGGGTTWIDARKVARWMLATEKQELTRTDITRGCREFEGKKMSDRLNQALELLQRNNWISVSGNVWAPQLSMTVNPVVFEKFSQHGIAERKRRLEERKRLRQNLSEHQKK